MSSTTTTGLVHLLRRPRDKAVLDRYGLVRKFFIRDASTNPHRTHAGSNLPRFPSLTPASNSISQLSNPGFSWAWSSVGVFSISRAHHSFRYSSVHFRAIHTTSRIQRNQRPPPTDEPPPSPENSKSASDGPPKSDSPIQPDPRQFENYSKFFRQLAMSLPHLHRPTRDDFLNATTGFWQRTRIRFKWLTIRSFRRYNADDISAFITWFFMSQTIWLLVGT